MRAGTRVLLLGAGGQLGTELRRTLHDTELYTPGRAEADLTRPALLCGLVRAIAPRTIVNAAAYTAVDRAESEPELADAVNHRAPAVLAEEAERLGALLVHYSTDYVFDGSKPQAYVETDATAPLNVYGASKLAGEQAVAAACRRALVLRTSWVYAAHGHNFLRTMLRLAGERDTLRVVSDQHGAPTSAAALAEATRAVLDRVESSDAPEHWAGVYHATCAGLTSWHGFAESIFAACVREDARARLPRVEAIASAAYPTPARRPANSVLDNTKLSERFGVRLPEWQPELERTLREVWAHAG